MIKTILQNTRMTIIISLIILLLGSCFIIDENLFNGIVTAKYLWVESLSLLAIVFVAMNSIQIKVQHIKSLDVLITCLCLWMTGREIFSRMPHANHMDYVLVIALYYGIFIFFRSINYNPKLTKLILVIYLLIIVSQAIIGLLQLYGFLYSHHSLFKITGTFHNPGPFSGFIVSGLPIALGLYLLTVKSHHLPLIKLKVLGYEFSYQLNIDRLLNYFAQFVIIVLLLVLPAARSRAAWLGGVIGCLYVVWQFNLYRKVTQWFTKNYHIKLNGSLQKILVSFALLTLVLSLFGIYKLKQGSADGRLFMWQVSWEMIKDKPFLGYGQGGFEANYANYQAEWFRSGKGTAEEEMVAGMPDAPFNELIRVGINYGFIGLLLVLLVLSSMFFEQVRKFFLYGRNKNNSEPGDAVNQLRTFNNPEQPNLKILLKGSLLSMIIFGFFSYPVDIAPIMVQFILLVALIINISTEPKRYIYPCSTKKHKAVTLILATLLFVLTPYAFLNLKDKYAGLKHWQEAHQLYEYGVYDDAAEEYSKATEYMPNNGLLKQMYGKSLAINKKYERAIDIFVSAKNYQSSSIIETTLGDCYKAIGKLEKAEKAYLQACNMEPAKFYPQYLLTKLYYESGEIDKVLALVKVINTKEIKVPSMAIKQMKEELNRLLQK